MAEERTGVVTFKGNPMTLEGPELKQGDTAPGFTATGADMALVSPLDQAGGKAKLFILVPSLDTNVCSMETKKFSDAVKNLGDQATVYTVSADLPFAQSRWCGAEGVQNITMLSDYRNMELARGWGLMIKEMGLLARAVYVLDKNNKVVYREIVPDIASEPDYAAALGALGAVS